MSNSEQGITELLHKVDLITQPHGPKNVVLVTTDDVIEIFHELIPYTMAKLDQVSS